MKKLLLIVTVLTLAQPSLCFETNSQSSFGYNPYTDKGWDDDDVAYFNLYKTSFEHKKMGVLYSFMQLRDMKIRFVGSYGTSPWITPGGKSYMRELFIYSRDLQMLSKGMPYRIIIVTLDFNDNDTSVDDKEFWRSMDDDKDEIEQFIEKTKNLVIKSCVLELMTWQFDE